MSGSDERVTLGQIAALIKQQPLALVANAANGAILFVILHDTLPLGALIAWVGTIWSVILLRLVVWYRQRGRPMTLHRARRTGRIMTALVIANGLAWGLPAAILFPSEMLPLQGFIVFVLGGMSAGAVATLSSHLPAFLGFLLPVLLPMIGRLLAEGTMLHMAMGAMGLVYFVVLISTGRHLNATLAQALALQMEKADLSETLVTTRAQAKVAEIAKSEFLATVSHELRTPLNAILGFSQLIQNEVHGDLGHPRYQEYIRHIRDSGAHLRNLVDELLTLASAKSGELKLADQALRSLPAILLDCLTELEIRAAQRNITLTLADPFPPFGLRADLKRLRQILLNVLSNAIKFTPDDGAIAVSLDRDSAGALIITVRDTGIGMSEEELRRCQDPFGRADSSHARLTEGVGLGLPMTTLLMNLHGGQVVIDSAPGRGTQVSLCFPPERVIEQPPEETAGDSCRVIAALKAKPAT